MYIHANMHACRRVLSLELLPRYFGGVWACNMCACLYASCVNVCMQQHLLTLQLLVTFCCVRVYDVYTCMHTYIYARILTCAVSSAATASLLWCGGVYCVCMWHTYTHVYAT